MFKAAISGVACGSMILVAACSFTTAVPVHPTDHSTWGFRVYAPKPIILVTDKGMTVAYIPNYSKAYAVRFDAFLAKNKTKLTISNGLLTEVDSDLDSTAIIPLLQQIAKDKQVTGGAATAEAEGRLIAVYDLVYDEGGNLIGWRKLSNDVFLHSRRRGDYQYPRSKMAIEHVRYTGVARHG